MAPRVLRVVAAAAVVISAASCRDGTGPRRAESWVADIASSRQVLFMQLTYDGATVRGSGTLASLTNPGGETLTLAGVRNADSLRITYGRAAADPFRFVGRYAGPGLEGVLDGGEFVQVRVAFRAR